MSTLISKLQILWINHFQGNNMKRWDWNLEWSSSTKVNGKHFSRSNIKLEGLNHPQKNVDWEINYWKVQVCSYLKYLLWMLSWLHVWIDRTKAAYVCSMYFCPHINKKKGKRGLFYLLFLIFIFFFTNSSFFIDR